ncbi:hypothetical protein E2P81_ATG02958 [Venturia nashicola]|uniref:Uncharacterized protein n=1 Tax=Venturia nashicola TaxID=86259 RepID=A0A4Z1PMD2_9PEZI|nr:hypothetical protein E6O75_ATG03020 [Venturia nashicola]TLD36069.1 hypothetical protein E2P81_ATG02958 [Venturia nashicola]
MTEPRTPTRNRSRTSLASPPTICTPRPSIRSEKSHIDEWWTEQEREQQEFFVGGRDYRLPDLLMNEAERVDPDIDNYNNPTIPISGLPRRGHSLIDATSSEWNQYLAESMAVQDSTTSFLESTIAIPDDDRSHSEYGSEQENQPPSEVPPSPPHEPTYRRLQRQPLRQLRIDSNGNLLLTPASLADLSPSSHERSLANSSQSCEDEELDSDAQSNASTVVLPNTQKRNVGDFEEEEEVEERYGSENSNHSARSRHTKRLKTSSRLGGVDGAGAHQNRLQTPAKFAPANAPTYTTPSGEGIIEDSDSDFTTSTIVPSPRKRSTAPREQEEDGSPRSQMVKRRRASSTGTLAFAGQESGDERRSFSTPAIGTVHSTPVRPQDRSTGTRLPAHRVWLPTPTRTPIAISTQHPVVESETDSMNAVLTRLEAAEVCFTRWLTEVRNKKDRYRRLIAQQKEDQSVISEDMGRLRQLEPIIQTMATKEMNEINENMRGQEGNSETLSAQRKEIRQRLLGFEKLRRGFEGERLADVRDVKHNIDHLARS